MNKVMATFKHWFGGGKTPAEVFPRDFEPADIETWHAVSPYTMTSPERVFALRAAVRYVVQSGICGDIVECGVWKGGSMMAVARTLLELNDQSRMLYLFDTFEGMPPPTAADVDYAGEEAGARLDRSTKDANVWAIAPLEQVKRAVLGVGYDPDRIRFVQGRVEDTIPGEAPPTIALLRLDTDWYESTRHELTHLFPRLSPGGVLIIDDYGHWQGARRATDEYLTQNRIKLLLNRIDYTGRVGIKLG
jgi:hypothetical protein